jgi:ubiquinone/menaquinone biosynthesis C-methylase UbiE
LIAPQHRSFLDPASPDSLLGAFAFNRDLQGLWNGLADCVRSGKPVMPSSPHLGSDPERTRRFVEGMHSRAALMARGFLQVVDPEPSSRILDLAGGPGTFSLRLVERDPSLSITVFDLPPVVQAAQQIHQNHPGLSSVSFFGGDYHQHELPHGFDMVFYCGALHQELPSEVPALLRKISSALHPGGNLLIVDLLLDKDRTTPVYSALFDLNMRLMKPTSHVHTVVEVEDALNAADFTVIRTGDVPETPYRFVQASKE